MNKKDSSKIKLKPKAPFKLGFVVIIPEISPERLPSEITFYNYLLIVDLQ